MDKEERIIPAYALDLIVSEHKTEKKRLWIALIIVFLAFILSNGAWIIHESMYEDVVTQTQTVTQEDEGSNTFNGDFYSGDYNGETNSD